MHQPADESPQAERRDSGDHPCRRVEPLVANDHRESDALETDAESEQRAEKPEVPDRWSQYAEAADAPDDRTSDDSARECAGRKRPDAVSGHNARDRPRVVSDETGDVDHSHPLEQERPGQH